MNSRRSRSLWRRAAAAGAATLLSACACKATPAVEPGSAAPRAGATAIVHATVIDGTGREPLRDGTVLVVGRLIYASGPSGNVPLPEGCRVIDAKGAALLPGFINAHVHNAFNERNAASWAASGVTTVRDLSCFRGKVAECLAFRDRVRDEPRLCRILSAGSMIVVPGGYESRYGIRVRSTEEARAEVGRELDAGVDIVKITLQSRGFLRIANLPPETAVAIVDLAHSRGKRVVAHVGRAEDLEAALDYGVDDIAHIVSDRMPERSIERMVASGIPMEPTLTNWTLARGKKRRIILDNLKRFADAGGIVALGAEYIPTEKILGPFVGMPMTELLMMREAGMTPMQVIVASTRDSAKACGIDRSLGTLEVGKIADLILVPGNPLEDLRSLSELSMVMREGQIIRGEP